MIMVFTRNARKMFCNMEVCYRTNNVKHEYGNVQHWEFDLSRPAAIINSLKNVCEGIKFSKQWTPFQVHIKDFHHHSSKTVMLLCNFSLKHVLMATGNFWFYWGQNFAGLCLFTKVRYGISQKKVYRKLYWFFLPQ